MQGKKVLLVDADPQGDLTVSLGWKDNDNLSITLADKILDFIQNNNSMPDDVILNHDETMLLRLVKELTEKEGVTEALKAEDGMKWVQAMNNIRNRAAEVVYSDLIYN